MKCGCVAEIPSGLWVPEEFMSVSGRGAASRRRQAEEGGGGGRRRAQFSERTAAGILRAILEGLGHMHARGIMHRDLKPENFLLKCVGRYGQPELAPANLRTADFGLAARIPVGARLKELVGSAYYIAPEVLEVRSPLTSIPGCHKPPARCQDRRCHVWDSQSLRVPTCQCPCGASCLLAVMR